jgi:hypothetical protein
MTDAALVLVQSDVKQTVRDAAENLLIAIGMGWDMEGCVQNLRAALARSDAEPDVIKTTGYNMEGDGGPQSDAEPVSAREDYEASCGLGFKMPPPRPDASAGLVEAAVLERYAQSIAMWCYRENVTDYERLSYIANHPVTRKYANRARAADRSGK